MKTRLSQWAALGDESRGFSGVLNSILTLLLFVLFAAMVLSIWLQMLVRWILSPYLGLSMPWTGSLATMALVILTFIGAAAASRDNDHIRISIVLDKLSGKWERVVNIINALLVIVFLAVFVVGSLDQAIETAGGQYQTLPPVAPFTNDWLYLMAAAGGSVMLVFTARDLLQNVGLDVNGKDHDGVDTQGGNS